MGSLKGSEGINDLNGKLLIEKQLKKCDAVFCT